MGGRLRSHCSTTQIRFSTGENPPPFPSACVCTVCFFSIRSLRSCVQIRSCISSVSLSAGYVVTPVGGAVCFVN